MRWAVVLILLASQAAAETVVATRTIRPQDILTAADVRTDPQSVAGAYQSVEDVIGLEARVAVYPGRPVMRGNLGAPALIERNQIIELIFRKGGLHIVADGRALGRGGEGERIRVMNISSRTTLFGTVMPNGSVLVTQ